MEQKRNLYRVPLCSHPIGIEKLLQWKISSKELRRGAFSTVFVATHKQQHRNVAMKVVPLDKLEEEYVRLSMNEVSLLKEIKSPNIIELIDSFIANNILYVAVELTDGNDLSVRINIMRDRGTIFSDRTIWYTFYQICAGLKHLHDKRIIHRDLKPANIFMTSKYQVKIGDLGLSHQFSGNSTMVNNFVGTAHYMSPEREKGEYYGFPADIWSLGCILYELCTFRSPFSGKIKNPFSLRRKIVNREIIDLPMNEYSEKLCYFIDACLCLKAEKRPSAKECYIAALRMFNGFEAHARQEKAAKEKARIEKESAKAQQEKAAKEKARIEKERAQARQEKAAKEKADSEAQAQKEKIESESNMEFLKMATKDSHTFLGNEQKHSKSNSFSQQNDQYKSLNLNQNQKSSVFDHSQSKHDFSDSKSTKNYNTSKALDQFAGENGDREKKDFSWNKSDNGFQSTASNGLNNYDSKENVEDQKRWKNCDIPLKNESTLSLHIAACETFVEVENSDEPLKNKPKTKTLEKIFTESYSKNPFEFSRQKEESANEPEISQFKASQRLPNSNSNANDGERVNTRTSVYRAVQIVEHVAEGEFKVNEEALRKLLLTERVANKKVVVFCIAGESRGGKSFLLNFGIDKLKHDEEHPGEAWQLHASKRLSGFQFRGGENPTTMGIWAWDHVPVIKHGDEEYAVLMIDSQGTFDSDTSCGDGSTILSMAGIFSSYFCYNVEKNLHENKLNELYSFVNHGKLINDDLGGNGKLFQNLAVIVRDFQDHGLLKLKNGGQIYVKNELTKRTSDIETRVVINASYEKLYGFILPYPGKKVAEENSSIIGEMDDKFVHLTKEMFETLLSPSTLQPKRIGDKPLTCQQAFSYFTDTVKCFNDNKKYAPEAMYAVRRNFLINLEVDRAMDIYKSQMDKVFLNCKTGYESAKLNDIHKSIVEDLKIDFKKLNKNIRDDVVKVILNRIDKLFDAYKRNNETLVEAEKKRVQEAEAERKNKENVARLEKEKAEAQAQQEKDAKEKARLEKERAEAQAQQEKDAKKKAEEEVKKAEIEAQAQKEKMKHERNMEYLKAGVSVAEAVGNVFIGIIGIRRRFR